MDELEKLAHEMGVIARNISQAKNEIDQSQVVIDSYRRNIKDAKDTLETCHQLLREKQIQIKRWRP